jgi:hypothetical protein
MSLKIPQDYTEFLYWVKERTESFWSKNPETSEDDFVCEEWAYGAKWIGLKETEIDLIEKKYNIRFTSHHREFLKILHTINQKKIYTHEPFEENGEIEYEEVPFFYNWNNDDDEIKEYLSWPYRTIFEDVIGPNKVWLESWGKVRPKSKDDKEKIFAEWFKKTPKLIPINMHRFVVGEPIENMSPVLSIYGSDIIVYGWNMRHYLLNELKEHLDLFELIYDDEDNEWYSEPIKELQEVNVLEYGNAKKKTIPVLEEMILYWSSGWSSYGKEYPNPNNEIIRPIVKTFIPEDETEENSQKTFNDFEKNKDNKT